MAHVLLVRIPETGMTYKSGVGQIHADVWDVARLERRRWILRRFDIHFPGAT